MLKTEQNAATRTQLEVAVTSGSKFCTLFYDTFDKTRHKIGKLYHDSAQLVWRGNGVQGKANIEKYLQELPGCFHHVDTLDCQPVLAQFTSGKETMLVSVSGTVKYDGHSMRGFTQNFTLTNVDGVWKIVSDCIRLRDP